jgi:hypothetical protein
MAVKFRNDNQYINCTTVTVNILVVVTWHRQANMLQNENFQQKSTG